MADRVDRVDCWEYWTRFVR